MKGEMISQIPNKMFAQLRGPVDIGVKARIRDTTIIAMPRKMKFRYIEEAIGLNIPADINSQIPANIVMISAVLDCAL